MGFILKRTPSFAECFNKPLRIGGTIKFITRIALNLARVCSPAQWPYRFALHTASLRTVQRNKRCRLSRHLLPDAKARKNDAEQVVSGEFPGDRSERLLRLA